MNWNTSWRACSWLDWSKHRSCCVFISLQLALLWHAVNHRVYKLFYQQHLIARECRKGGTTGTVLAWHEPTGSADLAAAVTRVACPARQPGPPWPCHIEILTYFQDRIELVSHMGQSLLLLPSLLLVPGMVTNTISWAPSIRKRVKTLYRSKDALQKIHHNLCVWHCNRYRHALAARFSV